MYNGKEGVRRAIFAEKAEVRATGRSGCLDCKQRGSGSKLKLP
jgi:hypothetical protein